MTLLLALFLHSPAPVTAGELESPVRLESDGKPIALERDAYAGPLIRDVDGDGDRDLIVTGIMGAFHLYDNVGTDAAPVYTSVGDIKKGDRTIKLRNW